MEATSQKISFKSKCNRSKINIHFLSDPEIKISLAPTIKGPPTGRKRKHNYNIHCLRF